MDLADVRFLFGYDRWATRKILAAASGVDADGWGEAEGDGHRGLGATLVHVLGAHQRWRHAIARTGEEPEPERGPLPSPDELAEAWTTEWSDLDNLLDTLSQGILDHVHEGVPVAMMLVHVVNHGTQHRSEAAVTLTGLERSPGDLDLIDYAEEVAAAARSGESVDA